MNSPSSLRAFLRGLDVMSQPNSVVPTPIDWLTGAGNYWDEITDEVLRGGLLGYHARYQQTPNYARSLMGRIGNILQNAYRYLRSEDDVYMAVSHRVWDFLCIELVSCLD